MKSIHLKSSVGSLILLLLIEVSLAQQSPRRTYKEHGGELVGDSLIFKGRADFYNATFDDEANFRFAKFDDEAKFSFATFNHDAFFVVTTFNDNAYFGAAFDSVASFRHATFNHLASFNGAKFHHLADFSGATFNDNAYFGAAFDSVADFSSATFVGEANFVQARFAGTVDFTHADFRQSVDFRQTNFDSVQNIYFEDITFPDGKLLFYWHQFKGKDSLRIKLEFPPTDSLDRYNRIEIIYHRLRDNFLAQQDKASADAVMYELGWQKKEILGEFWWKLYDWFFGYGFQPWRFLFFVIAPLIVLFAGIWYWFYYGMLIFINPTLSPQITTENPLAQKEKYLINFKKVKSIKIRFNDFSSLKGNINRLTRYWHAILFSAGVLLGIRFKEKWTQACPDNILGRRTFIYIVTFEWLLGIGLIVTFALLVKGARFGFIRDLLGF